jgi:hypothetical protein
MGMLHLRPAGMDAIICPRRRIHHASLWNDRREVAPMKPAVFSAVTMALSRELRQIITMIQVSLISLKLAHVIDWSWWRIWSPTWITSSLAISALLATSIGVLIYRRGKESVK